MNDSDSGKDRAERKKVFHFGGCGGNPGRGRRKNSSGFEISGGRGVVLSLDIVKSMLTKVVKS